MLRNASWDKLSIRCGIRRLLNSVYKSFKKNSLQGFPVLKKQMRISKAVSKGLSVVLRLAVCVTLYVWLVHSGCISFSKFQSLDSASLLSVFGLTFLALFIPTIRLWILLNMGSFPTPFERVIRITWAGYLAGVLLPGVLAGDAVKAIAVASSNPKERLLRITLLLSDRVIGLLSLISIAAMPSLSMVASDSPAIRATASAILAAFAMAIVVLALLSLPWIQKHLLRRLVGPPREVFLILHDNAPKLLVCLLISFASSAATLLSLVAAFYATGTHVSLYPTLQAGSVSIIAASIPVTPSGLGLGEAATETVFGWFGIPSGAMAMLLVRLSTILWSFAALMLPLGTLEVLSESMESRTST